jgi:hypothetical protein
VKKAEEVLAVAERQQAVMSQLQERVLACEEAKRKLETDAMVGFRFRV